MRHLADNRTARRTQQVAPSFHRRRRVIVLKVNAYYWPNPGPPAILPPDVVRLRRARMVTWAHAAGDGHRRRRLLYRRPHRSCPHDDDPTGFDAVASQRNPARCTPAHADARGVA